MLNVWRLVTRRPSLVAGNMSFYAGAEPPLEEVRKQLLKYEGGSVDLVKDEETGIATLCLNHPEKKNALSGKMIVNLADSISELQNWKSGKATLLFGANHTFCSGADLSTAKHINNPDDGFSMATFMHRSLTQLYCLPMVTVALVEDKAIGGGAELTTACDFRVFSAGARIGFVHGRMGVVPGWGGGTRLASIVGYRKALNLVTTGQILNADEAVSLGLSDTIVTNEDSFQQAIEFIKKRTAFAPEVLHAMKMIMVNARDLSFEESLMHERRLFAPLWGGPANQQALQQNIKHK